MAEHQLTLASAVIVPESSTSHKTSPTSVKRAGFPLVNEKGKQLHLEVDDASPDIATLSNTDKNVQVDRRSSGAMEERKRGKRLFGALLGTLSQSSSSAAEKRRIDIEKKQQAKLKSQSDQLDEKTKQQHSVLQEMRKEQQKKYEHESRLICSSNETNMARFLVTDTRPQLYYKPWELLVEENEKIASQIKEADSHGGEKALQISINHVQNETLEATHDSTQVHSADDPSKSTVGDIANTTVAPTESHCKFTDPYTSSGPEVAQSSRSIHERERADDTGEVVEGDEDTVIY